MRSGIEAHLAGGILVAGAAVMMIGAVIPFFASSLREGFFSLSLYGIAMNGTGGASGWAFVAGGSLGIVLGLVGGTIPAFVYFGTGALAIATRRLGVSHPAV